MASTTGEGLRERKKRRTRLEISDVATRLFAEHGFEAVTLAQIAEAAEVSVKTIFNHFGSKEDLYFDRAQEVRDGLVGTITGRPAGTTVLESLHRLAAENFVPLPGQDWAALHDPEGLARFRAFLSTQDRSPALRARALTLTTELAAELARVLAAELGRERGDAAVLALTAMIVATLSLRAHVLSRAIAEGVAPAEVERRVRAAVDEAFGRLARAFDDVDRVRA